MPQLKGNKLKLTNRMVSFEAYLYSELKKHSKQQHGRAISSIVNEILDGYYFPKKAPLLQKLQNTP